MALGLCPHSLSCFVFSGQLAGYVALSTCLERVFYRQRGAAPWRCQPATPPRFGGLPLLDLLRGHRRSGRHPCHAAFATLNLVVSALFAGATAEAALRGASTLTWEGSVPASLLAALAWQSVLEYWWHCVMHTRLCYARLHRLHHFYKSPQPFDDLFIHPLEAAGYYAILYSPALVIPRLHVLGFLLYVALLGVAGVVDHSGVRVVLAAGPLTLYDSGEHDLHHSAGFGLRCLNLGFPTTLLDKLHGTHAPAWVL